MPLKNIELAHGGRNDTFVWRLVIPANKKEAYRPKLCWVNKKPFSAGEILYFYHVKGEFPFKEERYYLSSSLKKLVAVASKYDRYVDIEKYVFKFRYEGEDIRHYCRKEVI